MNWEYRELRVKDEDLPKLVDALNEAGAEGWEVIGDGVDTGWGMTYLMKRNPNGRKEVVATDGVASAPSSSL